MKKLVFILMMLISGIAIADDINYCNVEDYEIRKYIIEGDIAIVKFGDDVVGYYYTKEEYINVYDSVITSLNIRYK